tara:strand:+ start:605 stop:880 length:276 start_codon:yes stop_codon:yes gene_type:complete
MGNGKMSSIRLTSNSTYGMYNNDGTLKVEGKKELKKYLKIKEQEQKSIDDSNRPKRIRRKIDGVWTEISNAGDLTNSNNDIDTIEENTIEK